MSQPFFRIKNRFVLHIMKAQIRNNITKQDSMISLYKNTNYFHFYYFTHKRKENKGKQEQTTQSLQ